MTLQRIGKFVVIGGVFSTLLACGEAEKSNQRNGNKLAQKLALYSQSNGSDLLDKLRQERGSVALNDLVTSSDTPADLKSSIQEIESFETMVMTVPLDQHRAGLKVDPNNLFTFVPDVDEKDLRTVEAFDANGNGVELSVNVEPTTPVVVIARDEALPEDTADIVVTADEVTDEVVAGPEIKVETEGSLKLDRVAYADLHEPWIKGRPEMYAIVTYMGKDGKGGSTVVEIEGIGREKGKLYSVSKLVHFWPVNKYQFVDISFLEHDTGADYSSIATATLSAAATITAVAYPPAAPFTAPAADILNAAIKAIPGGFWTDDDDYIDTINLVEKYKDGDERKSINDTVTAIFSTYRVKRNDE